MSHIYETTKNISLKVRIQQPKLLKVNIQTPKTQLVPHLPQTRLETIPRTKVRAAETQTTAKIFF
jgi:hypothetical protein